jgi:tetratricopeptide (TPR) repeat protein
MAPLTYLNFDLQFERAESGYRIEASGPDGRYTAVFQLPFSATELENLVLRVGRTRTAMRRIDPPEIEAAKQFGNRLYTAVFGDQIGVSFRRGLDQAEQRGAGLRVRVRLTHTPELANLPWEYLYDQIRNRFLALSVETPLVRYLDIPERIRPLTVELPLRALAIIASPRGQVPLDVEREWANIQAASGDLLQRGALVLDRLPHATLSALQRRLRQAPYHILHFVGHGAFDQRLQDGVLMLEDDRGDEYRVSGQELGMLLHDQRSLRLAMLNVCEGGRSAIDDPFAGVAQSLVQQGIPAVIAMQFEVSDEAAIALAHEFYSAVTDGYPVDAALSEARKSVFAQGYRLEWGTPVLYLRAPDGQIFETSTPAAPAPAAQDSATRQRRVEELYTTALALFYTRRWDEAIAAFEQVLALDADHADAAAKLAQAQRDLRLARSYELGRQAFGVQDWAQAITHLQAVIAIDASYRDAAGLLQTAQQRDEVARLYDEASALAGAQSWQAVLNVIERIQTLDPAFSDPAGLAPAAREALEGAQRATRLATLYNQGLLHMREERWSDARSVFSEIEQIQPGYHEAAALLARAREELAPRPAPAATPVAATVEAARQPVLGNRHLAAPRLNLGALGIAALGMILNIGLGEFALATRALPLYLDTIGTIAVGALLGPWAGLVTGLVSHTLWTLSGLPGGTNAIWFSYAPAVVGMIAGFAARAGLFTRPSPRWLAAITGALLGLVLGYCVVIAPLAPLDLGGAGLPYIPPLPDVLQQHALTLVSAIVAGAALGFVALRRVGYAGVLGLATGAVTTLINVPMVLYVFSDMRGASLDQYVASIAYYANAQLIGNYGAISGPLDKLVTFVLAALLIRVIPADLVAKYSGRPTNGAAVPAPASDAPSDAGDQP